MKYENELALIIAYYLSRFDNIAYSRLGMGSKNKTHDTVGAILGVNPNTVKNMRDGFDPIHDNNRVGWYQSELAPSRVRVVEMFGDLQENSLYEIVKEILENKELENQDGLKEALDNIQKNDYKSKRVVSYTTRGITGKKAEEYFMENYKEIFDDDNTILEDKRTDGQGFDFIIKVNDDLLYIEVKGLNAQNGGILLTDKEWSAAQQYQEKYYLILIKNLGNDEIERVIINNPYKCLDPKKQITTVIQVNWQASEKEIQTIISG